MAKNSKKENEIAIPLALVDARIVTPEAIPLYVWLKRACDENKGPWNVDFRELALLSGMSVPKLSTCFRALERNGFLLVERAGRGKMTVEIAVVPAGLERRCQESIEAAKESREIKKLNAELKKKG